MTTINKATDRQVSFIQTLLKERVWEQAVDVSVLSSKDASGLIDNLLKAPKDKAKVVVEIGIYQNDKGDIYRVQPSRQTGRLYAKKLVFTGGWEYESGAIYRLKPEQKWTLEQAKAFGAETGLCCVCGAFLTDPNSVAEGIGPVCAKRV